MSPYPYAWLRRKSMSFGKKRRQTIPAGQDLHPAPKSGSLDKTRPWRITPGDPESLPDLRLALFGERVLRETVPKGPNPRPDPGSLSPLRREMPRRETTPGRPNPRPNPGAQEDTPPPSYTVFDLRGATSHNATPQRPIFIEENVTVETLRAHNPATRTPRPGSHILEPPPRRTAPDEVACAAACSALVGINRAFDEQDPRMVAARTAQAIAVAVSTSRSYTAFLAAVTAAESFALLSMEDSRYQVHVPNDQLKDRYTQASSIATNTAAVADASITATGPWLSSIHNTRAPERQPQPQHRTPGWMNLVVGTGIVWAIFILEKVAQYCREKERQYTQ